MNDILQFRVLYRQFLFRLMESESLSSSARGDSSVLLGQFGALLVFGSVLLSWGAVSVGNAILRGGLAEPVWSAERFLISLTMFAVGVFALVNWDSVLPDRRDVLVLGPLPIRVRALLAAKVAAGASALGLTVAALNCLAAFAWPIILTPAGGGAAVTLRFVGAFWATMFAAGGFVYCGVLGVQAAAAQLPRRWYLRASPILQVGLFAGILGGVCFQPVWLPTYWFTGLLCELSGLYSDQTTATLAQRAVVGVVAAATVAAGAFLLSYVRTLRKIVEEPDAAPAVHGRIPLPRFGAGPQTAVAQFIVRTLLRSSRHRVVLSFYLGGGFALAVVYLGIAGEEQLPAASLILLCAAWLGTRTVFSLPMELRANWLFRTMPGPDGSAARAAVRRALLAVSVLPVAAVSAIVLLWFGRLPAAVGHVLVLGLIGSVLADLSLRDFHKIPFTCSYLPGKSKAHMVFWFGIIPAMFAIHKLVELETRAMASPVSYLAMVSGLGALAVAARGSADRVEPEIRFDETAADQVIGLGLDG